MCKDLTNMTQLYVTSKDNVAIEYMYHNSTATISNIEGKITWFLVVILTTSIQSL